MTRIAGSHVVVTGGSQGIGLATAAACARRGGRVSILARDPEKLAKAHVHLPRGVATASADVTDASALEAGILELTDAQGPCDILVAAAGRAEPGHFLDLDADVFARQMELNYLGMVHAVRAVLPGMVARGRGHLVLVSSVSGLVGVFGYGAYTPTKFAVRGLGEALEGEFRDRGIVTSIVKGIERDRLHITAELQTRVLARLSDLHGPLLRAALRRRLRRR